MLPTSPNSPGTILLVGASRGLGLAMADEMLTRGWTVVATVRGSTRTGLHDLVDRYPGRMEVESVDITSRGEIAALRDRLIGRRFDMLFCNAGIANDNPDDTIAEVSTEEFGRVMVTNVLGPMRVIEGLQGLVTATGLIGVMSSGQGSVGNNEKGGREVYRSSKAALNMAMRSLAAHYAGQQRALVLLAPGWIRTELGGPDAPFGIADSIPKIVDVLVSAQGQPGLRYLDRDGRTVPW